MAAVNNDCCYIGVGMIYVGEYICGTDGVLVNTPKRFIGNTSNFQIDVSQNTRTQPDFTTVAGGPDCTVTTIDEVTVQMDVACFKSENLAFALFGETFDALAGTGFTETLFAPANPADAFLALQNLPDTTNNPIVVADALGTVYVERVDYTVGSSGITLTESTTIPGDSELVITYDHIACSIVEMLTAGSSEVSICFDGRNAATDRPFRVTLNRVRLNPTASLGLISDDFQSITLTGTALRDATIQAGGGISQFGTIKQAG